MMGNKVNGRESKLLEEFLVTDFNGGTLVEYLELSNFAVEYGRSKIKYVKANPGLEVVIEEDGMAMLAIHDTSHIVKIRKEDGVFYLHIPLLYDYAIAPKGVTILGPDKRLN